MTGLASAKASRARVCCPPVARQLQTAGVLSSAHLAAHAVTRRASSAAQTLPARASLAPPRTSQAARTRHASARRRRRACWRRPVCGSAARARALHFQPLDGGQRLRCLEVCRGWRATLADQSAWLQLDLTRADGSECSEALLRAATSRAGGQLRSLRLACGYTVQDSLCAVAAGNAATLQELRLSELGTGFRQRYAEDVRALLRAAPQLRTLEADVYCDNTAYAQRVLRNEPPFGSLRVLQLHVIADDATAESMLALAADLAAHASLASVRLQAAPFDEPATLDAVVDAALERRLSSVHLIVCHLRRRLLRR
jgi:hypothetical protein